MVNDIKELTLLLLYLSSWEEDDGSVSVHRNWKGYLFETLDELHENNYIYGSCQARSIYFAESGIEKARELLEKYLKV